MIKVNFTHKELIEINISVSQNLSKFKNTLKQHEKETLESIFNKTKQFLNSHLKKPKNNNLLNNPGFKNAFLQAYKQNKGV